MILTHAIYADYSLQDPINFAMPLSTWGWLENRGNGILYECAKEDKTVKPSTYSVSYRRFSDHHVDDEKTDFGFGSGGYHLLQYPRLEDTECDVVFSTLYITDGDNAQKCNVTTTLELDDCELQNQNGVSNPLLPPAGQEQGGNPTTPTTGAGAGDGTATGAGAGDGTTPEDPIKSIQEMEKDGQIDMYLQFIHEQSPPYPFLQEMSDTKIKAYLSDPKNAADKITIDNDLVDAINAQSDPTAAKPAPAAQPDPSVDPAAPPAKPADIQPPAPVTPADNAASPSPSNSYTIKDIKQMTPQEQIAYAQFAIQTFTDFKGQDAKTVIATLAKDPASKKQVDEKLLAYQQSEGTNNLQKRNLASDASQCGKKKKVLVVHCPDHALNGDMETALKDSKTTDLKDDNPVDDPIE
eukprot:NODE_260_length_11481_cov_1.187928.p3 type:complete len:409 gc:universal NODE_260_length_11481_cov_1.187928:9902-11128(+)